MTPYKLGIQVGASGGTTFRNFLATATSGMNAAGQAGRVGAVGVNALGAAAQKQTAAMQFMAAQNARSVVGLGNVGNAAHKTATNLAGIGQAAQNASPAQAQLQGMLNRVNNLLAQTNAMTAQTSQRTTGLAGAWQALKTRLQGATPATLATAQGVSSLGNAAKQGVTGVAALNQSAKGVAGLQQLLQQVTALKIKAAGLSSAGQQGASGVAALGSAAQQQVNPINSLLGRIQALKQQAGQLQQQNNRVGLSFSSIGHGTRIAGSFVKGLGIGGGQAIQNLTGTVGGLAQMTMQGVFSLRMLAATAGAGLLGSAMVQTNRSFEQQQIGMAALIKSTVDYRDSTGKLMGDQAAFQESLKVSSSLIRQYEMDALKGAGTTDERIIVTNATVKTLMGQAGGSLVTMRSLANEVVTTSKLVPQLAGDIGQAARDASLILSGNANSDTLLFTFLRDQLGEASTFNKLTAPERLIKFREAMRTMATPALINAQATSFDGLTSSLSDFAAKMTRTLGQPFFGQVKAGMQSLVNYLVTSDGSPTKAAKQIETQVTRVGAVLGNVTNKVVNFLVTVGSKVVAIGLGAYNLFQTYITPAIDAVVPIFQGFFNTLKTGVSWVTDNIGGMFSLVSDNSGKVNTNFQKGAVFLAQLTANAASFIGLGFGAVLAPIAIGVAAIGTGVIAVLKTAVEGFGILATEINSRGSGITGFIKLMGELWEGVGAIFNSVIVQPITSFFNGMVTWATKALDDTFEAVLKFGRNTIETSRGIPVIGGALGGAADLSGASAAIDDQLAQISQRRNERERQAALDRRVAAAASGVAVNVNQTITAPSPQLAAAAANRGVGVAVAKNIPGAGKVGAPIVRPAGAKP